MAKRPKTILKDLLRSEGVTAAIILEADGTVVDTVALDEVNVDTVGGLAAMAIGGVESIGAELKLGGLTCYLVEFESGKMAVARAGDRYVAVLAGAETLIGAVRYELQQLLPELTKVLSR